MFRSSLLVPLLTLLAGSLFGWAVASGRLESVLRADVNQPDTPVTGCTTQAGCCDGIDKSKDRGGGQ